MEISGVIIDEFESQEVSEALRNAGVSVIIGLDLASGPDQTVIFDGSQFSTAAFIASFTEPLESIAAPCQQPTWRNSRPYLKRKKGRS
jgi:hypothetical protein